MTNAPTSEPLLDVRHLKKYFPIRGGVFSRVVGNVKAVEEVSFTVKPGEVVTAKARAISTIWRRAIERSPTTSSVEMPWPGKTRSSMSPMSCRAARRQPGPEIAGWATQAFSATVRFGQSDNS